MTSRLRMSYRGVGEMLRSEGMQAEMLERAKRVEAAAVAAAPVFETGPHPGRYKAAFHAESGVRKGKRAYGRVTNDSPEAAFVEYGTKNNPAHHTLLRALDAAT